ncbi:uncharacterized protein LDX57_007866 [Aspergillus melleus]|uniref:uncharacterized protein n=1 Tax=Aspergillus melleus TaxID=138277 RepID=UPI001E8D15F2|nr:uncharacterized protein LDX57_007866 [Aspergillus melleus]KAH8430196.1 hypothetical protein LDX57_007866 [Aspergillus melleus]
MDRSKNLTASNPEEERAELLTARQITMDPYPKFAELPQNHSSGTGLHEIDFVGELRYWSEFLPEVRKTFRETKWDDDRKVSARLCPQDLNLGEYFRCGAEISTSGRYVTHVLNPMSGIAKHLGYNITSGDWSVAGVKLEWPRSMPAIPAEKDRSSIPDYVLVDTMAKKPRALGEAKHPWGKNTDQNVKGARKGDAAQEKLLRRFLGQVSRDMWAAKLKLGFMTTYTWTVFIRRDIVDKQWVLFYSDAIHHTTKSEMGTSDISASVRECMLYFFTLASGDRSNWSLENEQQEPLEQWVKIIERKASSRSKATDATVLPQQVHRIPSEASLRPPTPTTSKTTQLPQRPRNPGLGQSKSNSTAVERSKYTDVGEISTYQEFYKFTLNGRLQMKHQEDGLWIKRMRIYSTTK